MISGISSLPKNTGCPCGGDSTAGPDLDGRVLTAAYEDPGVLVNSKKFDGQPSELAKEAITAALEEKGSAAGHSFSPEGLGHFPAALLGGAHSIIYCERCGPQTAPVSDLPIVLPWMWRFPGKAVLPWPD